MAGRVVLVTGVARYLGAQCASALQHEPDVDRVIGVDVVPPRHDLGQVEFVRADIRNPMIAKVIATAEVDTVLHTSIIATPLRAGGRTSMKEINVIGTMQLLAACQKAPSMRKLVVKSTTAVYGSSPWDPALFTEEMEPRILPRSGFAKDCVEVEGYVRGFARRRPDVDVTILRFANFLGPDIDSALAQYFAMPVLPTVLGFDARLQFVHEEDGREVLRRAVLENHPGTFNVAGDGVMLLSQAARRLGRPIVPVPSAAVSFAGGLLRQFGLADYSSEQLRLLTHGRAVDTTRLRKEFGAVLSHTTSEAFADFVRVQGGGLLAVDRVAQAEATLSSLLTGGRALNG